MKKLTLFFILCLLMANILGQSRIAPFLFLEEKTGSIVEVSFSDGTLTIRNNQILIDTPEQHYVYDYDDVESFYFRDKENRVEIVNTPNLRIFFDNCAILRISGDTPLGDIIIYDINGRILKQVQTDATEISVNLSHLSQGVYLVKTKSKTVKIVK